MVVKRKQQVKYDRSFRFNLRSLESLPAHDKNSRSTEQEYSDTGCPGLKVSVSKNGKKHYLHRYQVRKGRKMVRRCYRIGVFPAISVSTAREVVYEQKRNLQLHGIDPQEEKQAKADEITFGEFFETTYMEEHAKMNKKSWKSDLIRYESDLKDEFGDMLLSEIKRPDIKLFLNKIKRRSSGPNANRYQALISVVFSQAQEYISEDLANPCRRLKKFSENNPREKYLDLEAIGRLKSALDICPQRISALLIWFLLTTGCRLGEAVALTWDKIDMESKKAYLSNNMTKNSRARLVILNSQAMETLRELRNHKMKKNPHVFPGRGGPTGAALSSPRKTWSNVKKWACLDEDLHLHDLRHSYASLLASGDDKPSLYVVSQLLGHSDQKQSQRYAHLFSNVLEKASASVSTQLDRATK